MYQIFEVLPGDGPARLCRPGQPVSLSILCALLDATRLMVTRTPQLGLLVWTDVDCFVKGREPNPTASAVARTVFESPAAAVCGPLLVTGGSVEQPTALSQAEADEAFAYLFASAAGSADEEHL